MKTHEPIGAELAEAAKLFEKTPEDRIAELEDVLKSVRSGLLLLETTSGDQDAVLLAAGANIARINKALGQGQSE